MADSHSYAQLKADIAHLAEHLAPHHFTPLATGIFPASSNLGKRKFEGRPTHQVPSKETIAIKSHTTVLDLPSLQLTQQKLHTAQQLPQQQGIKLKPKTIRKRASAAALGASASEPVRKLQLWQRIVAHFADLAIVIVTAIACFLALKVALFGYQETVQDGLKAFLKQWLKILAPQEMMLVLYGLFFVYALFFKIVVGTTLGGLLFTSAKIFSSKKKGL